MGERVKRIFRNLNDGVDLIVFLNSVDPHIDMSFFYATGVTDGLFEGCAAWLTPDGKAAITTSALEEEAAKKSGLPLDVFRTRDESSKLIKKRLAGHRKIGINASELTYAAFQRLRKLAPRAARFVDVSGAVMKARLVKDAQEVDLIQRACDIASRAFEETLSFIQTGRTGEGGRRRGPVPDRPHEIQGAVHSWPRSLRRTRGPRPERRPEPFERPHPPTEHGPHERARRLRVRVRWCPDRGRRPDHEERTPGPEHGPEGIPGTGIDLKGPLARGARGRGCSSGSHARTGRPCRCLRGARLRG